MIRSVSVPQLVNGSGPCSPSSSIEEVFQEEEVGIYGKEGMMISFETDSGSCSGSEEGSREFTTSSQTSLTTHNSDSSLIFIFPPTHPSHTSNPPKKSQPPFPYSVHEPPPTFRHPPLPLTAIGCRQSQNQEHRLSSSYLDFTPSIETAQVLHASAFYSSNDPSTTALSAQALIAQAKRARTKSVRKRRSSAPSLSSPSTIRRSNTSSIISTISMPRATPFSPCESAINNGESPPASPRTPLSPTRSNGREPSGPWRGLRRALSLNSRESSNAKCGLPRTAVLAKDEACKVSDRDTRDGERKGSGSIGQCPQDNVERPFNGPSSPTVSTAEEWGGLGTLSQFPRPPSNSNLRRKSVRDLAGLGPPLLLLPKDGEEEGSSSSESEGEEGRKVYARPPSRGLPSTPPSADSQSSQESSLPPHTPITDSSPSLPASLLPPVLLTPNTPITPNTHTPPAANKKLLSLLSPETVPAVVDKHHASQRTIDDLQNASLQVLENNSDPQGKLLHSAMPRDWESSSLNLFPLSSRPFYHKLQPSVPCSTHHTFPSSFSSQRDATDTIAVSPPQSYANSSIASRNSRSTAASGSSGISVRSYTTVDSSLRSHQQWHIAERSDIATVVEEDDAAIEEIRDEFITKPLDVKRRPPLTQSASTSSVNRSKPTSNYFSRERSNSQPQHETINPAHSKQSSQSSHPFASFSRPVPPPTAKETFLSPQAPRRLERVDFSVTNSSRSSPNLARTYKMTQSVQQLALVSTEDDRDGDVTCPVCVEPMGFTYRLPGEKPPIIPECGHALHEECFTHVYGEVPSEGSRKVLGVCGVCRQPMKLADGATKKDKLSAVMGQPGKSFRPAPSIRGPGGRGSAPLTPPDPTADDPVDNSRPSMSNDQLPKVIVPILSIKSEFNTISKNRKGKQMITAMVSIDVPPAPDRGKYPAATRQFDEGRFSPQLPPSPTSVGEPTASPSLRNFNTLDPFAHVLQDLKNRVVDLKQLNVDSLGQLRLFDILTVRKGSLTRDFHVYLFQDALVCAAEEKKSGFRQMFSSSNSMRSDHSGHSSKSVLKLKGRIYLRHVSRVVDQSTSSELNLVLFMEDESLESFILTFKDRGSHETWRVTINSLIEDNRGPKDRAVKVLGSGAPRSASSGLAISFSDLTSPTSTSYVITPATSNFTPVSPKGQSPGDLAYNVPLAPIHAPIDLVLVLSLPAFTPGQSIPLKVKLMRSSLEFLLALLGPKDRISLVSCEMGVNSTLRKTPFLSTTRYESRKRLEAFLETLGSGKLEKDEFEVSVGSEEKLDVVTAMNVGLDVVLQRKAKNPISSMVIVSDTNDIIKRTQMDLVAARLDAANIPVHAVGYGRSHDPSPLWIVTNHTLGTYSFVKEWYHLRETLAGIVGGMMTVAMDNVKVHVSCVENDFRIMRVQGTTQAVVTGTGKDIDIELQDLRYGDSREILIELELENRDEFQRYSGEGSNESGHGSDPASQRGGFPRRAPSPNLGIDRLSVADSSYGEVIDEVPVCEVDLAFRDPAAGRTVSRLIHPQLLTVAIIPRTTSSTLPADPAILRRRMELLASDMLTRALLIASRKNYVQADRILRETKRIIETMQDNMRQHVSENASSRRGKSKREVQAIMAMEGLEGPLQDLEALLDGMEEQKGVFDRDCRNFTAQQSGVLRSQRAWTTRSLSERTYCATGVQNIIQMSAEWQSRFQ
ncbi:zinc finger family protein [Cryptococcus neoformans A2-102-5]|nr:zinc finger family protein [Cryptococcus neoformans var. grubii D17-1]OXG94994.1 zinc finger family protein [Cryptococcus neoformans var. grubii A2-102-5]